ncbi:MAG: benzaldehyde dehydrogenase [Sphingobium sp.]|uniref:benzaldehyde dehydrogenase n=1 Tax=Sphingomonas melonis TaxID=152682 RepID=UPI00036D1C86|nr:benzaldehyde dehydrogenase [Sphingomonas melonis]MAM39072.1 benzaldehyde dehydrogenase [Erythrobacter sp.]MBS47083.1 benzaldehyde dehydrogenase [Sphingobium sp.]|tara:strand:- start:2018 stop:3475 length:1458 start_codon:yes stop_codon:yes gene_type:complete
MSILLEDAHLDGRLFDGGWQKAAASYEVIEPATGNTLGRAGQADAALVRVAAASARKAQAAWAAGSPDSRAAVFPKAAAIGRAHWDEIVTWIMRESGSVRAKAEFELTLSIKAIELAGGMPQAAQGLVLPSEAGRLSLARRRPHGVVGIIAPFNFPLYLAMRAVAPALAVGNAVVLKPDPRTAVCGGYVIARLFELAGLPAGVLAVLPGGGDAGAALCADPNIAMIQFTGSTGAGRKVGEAASRNLKKVSLELGGKNSLIILEDADLDLAVRNAAWGAWLHQGEICMTAGRILVQAKILDAFAGKLAEKAEALPVGDPMSGTVAIGPIINKPQLDHALDVVADSVAAGATLLAGGDATGLCMAPTVLGGVTKTMPAYTEEIFGPVAVLVPFETDDEAVSLANDTEYGLSAAVISRDVGRAMALGERLHAGLLHINDQTVNDDVVNPFGGVGASGNGTAIGGPANWEEFTHWQWVTIKNAPPTYPL